MARYRYKRVRARVKSRKKTPSVPSYRSYNRGQGPAFMFDSGEVSHKMEAPRGPRAPSYSPRPKKLSEYAREEYKKQQNIMGSGKKKRYTPLRLAFG